MKYGFQFSSDDILLLKLPTKSWCNILFDN